MVTEQSAPPENVTNPERPEYSFTIVRPGGNDTCLINGIIEDPEVRRTLNDAIMSLYPNIEQVGFIDLSPGNERLQMAGGEFCGNATRSTAYLALGGEPGTLSLTVSGVADTLRAGIDTNGEAFAQMPIFPEVGKVRTDVVSPSGQDNFIVEMEGITQYIDFNSAGLSGLSAEDIKAKAMRTIREKGLTEYPAAGVMYSQRQGDSWQITPVVYVKSIDTLFLETACGSGTTALGMALSRINKQSITNLPVIQPTGIPINVQIDYRNDVFGYAQISGPVKVLERGKLEFDRNGEPFSIERVSDAGALQDALNSGGLNRLYQEIFGKPPYEEVFSDTEVSDIFAQYVSRGLLFVAKGKNGIVGFGAALPLTEVPEVADSIINADISADGWYMADLGVADAGRQKGIGKRLVEARLDALAGKQIVMRTSENNIISQSLYRSLGFIRIPGVQQDITGKRTDGSVKTDRRIFFTKKS